MAAFYLTPYVLERRNHHAFWCSFRSDDCEEHNFDSISAEIRKNL